MQRFLGALVVLVVGVSSTPAHFVWLIPSDPGSTHNSVHLIFSDNLKPDPNPKLLQKVGQTELTVKSASSVQRAALSDGKDVLRVAVPDKGPHLVSGVCKYGVVQRGKDEPFLLEYYPKTCAGLSTSGKTPRLLYESHRDLALEIVPLPATDNSRSFQIMAHGQPLAGAEVAVIAPGDAKVPEGKTGKDGIFTLERVPANGLYGIRARHVEEKEGELDGKKYKAIRRYATLTIPLVGNGAEVQTAAPAEAARKADPEATQLLAAARAARANWHSFPGFSADMEINIDGKVVKAPVTVTAKGEVEFKVADEDAARWARRTLGSLVGHRMDDSAALKSQCAFADSDTTHPLGRAITVLDDEFHSSYRIRDRQVIVVNRMMKDARFTITVMENKINDDKLFLPSTFVVNYWDLKNEQLKRSETHFNSWQRVGNFDLPREVMVVTATPGKLEARSIKLSSLHLLKQ